VLLGIEWIRRVTPFYVLKMYRAMRESIHRYRYYGDKYYCNICDSHLKSWIYAGPVEHMNRICPVCYSYGRQRFMALLLKIELRVNCLTSRMNLLHFSPELGLQRWIKNELNFTAYLSADLCSREVDINLDLQRIDLPDNQIDIIVLSHVLEHVENDALAIQEMYRVLAPEGKLFIQVPLSGDRVTQDECLAAPEARLARYGKTDHVRLYGDDILTRLSRGGFKVRRYQAADEIFRPDIDYMALDIPSDSTMLYVSESTIYVCQKVPGS